MGYRSYCFYPGLYAGATDLVGIYNGTQVIGDFKQTNKPKRKSGYKTISYNWQHMVWRTTTFTILRFKEV